MRATYKIIFSTGLLYTLLLTTACSTLNESVKLGAGIGMATGAASTYAAFDSIGEQPSSENMMAGAAIGLTLGLITAYYTHQSVEEKRDNYLNQQSEMYFGDLPPSPFVVPKSQRKRGRR